jgi:predicted DCC family thiol-disulfide oxidoreductase YuxK
MKKLYVLYDSSCGLCVRCAHWLNDQPAYLVVETVPSGSRRAERLFPELATGLTPEELTVIADTGEVYRDLAAWLMCLYALKRYRSWSVRLSRPGWRGLARRAVQFLTEHRDSVSGVLGLKPDFDRMVAAAGPPTGACDDGSCAAAPRSPLNARIREIRAAADRA